MSKAKVLWELSAQEKQKTNLHEFMAFASKRVGKRFSTWVEIYEWSISDLGEFWQSFAEFSNTQWIEEPKFAYAAASTSKMRGASWFKGGKLNFAQNFLGNLPETECITSIKEGQPAQSLSKAEVLAEVQRLRNFFDANDIKKGDIVAGVFCNDQFPILAMLAASSVGAVFASCSPDFGASGILDRFAPLKPKIIIFTSNYSYNGKIVDIRQTMSQVLEKIGPNCISLDISDWKDKISTLKPDLFAFTACDFQDPLYIMFSSGTTGAPKAIMHSVGGTLLQHKKELLLHCNLQKGDPVLFYTTLGWMMWNWVSSALAVGARVVCYEGSPSYPDLAFLFRLIDEQQIVGFGTSPKFLSAVKSAGIVPKNVAKLASLKYLWSTGSVLSPEMFDWVYGEIKSDLHLASISGGTDILSCFMLGNPLLPVRRGLIQSAGLGMAIAAFDEEGKPCFNREAELVCTKPFPSMPIGFFGDADGAKYREAYFDFYADREIWRHGDYVLIDDDGGILMHGRSDATLNPSGVRIGTSEIYRQVEKLPEVKDSLAVGFKRGADEEILLLVQLNTGAELNGALEAKIKEVIQKNLTRRHVPSFIYTVDEIPYTRSGKKVEGAASRAINGKTLNNLNAIANPGCLSQYARIGQELRTKV